jgi:aspartate/methionine/tyrosine aminotransferase
MFTTRTNWPTELNPLAIALDERRRRGLELLDLTESNPTVAGFHYDERAILSALASPAAMRYEPSPRGLLRAREAVAGYYGASGLRVDPSQIVLATGTSEAYSHAMRLLAATGDEILCPSPSYPLFDFLAALNDVRLVDYPLIYEHGWRIDLHRLRSLVTTRSRAIIVVNPNNPTGSYLSEQELEALSALAKAHGLSLIVDEVFRDYAWDTALPANRILATTRIDSCLTFTLNGLSKLAALPQMKLAWTVVSGPSEATTEALRRLEVIADTYLSVSTPVQHAAGALLAQGENLRQQILERVWGNLALLDDSIRGTAVDRLQAEGGWYATLRLPNTRSDEGWAIELLQAEGVYVHPGHFFRFPRDNHLVISLLPEPAIFRAGIERILTRVARVS